MISKIGFRTKRIICGLLLITIGLAYLGAQIGYWNFTLFFPGWWTMFLIIPAIYSMLEYGIYFSNVWMVLIGGYFLASANHWIDSSMTFPIFMAISCICIGIRLLCTRRVKWYGYKADGYKD